MLFVGDAVGVRLPQVGVLRPATPPPDFDLDQALHSLGRFADRRPSGLALAHYGLTPGDPADLLAEAESTLQAWAAVAEAAFRDGRDIAAALDEAFAHELDQVAPEAREISETLNGVHANAAGFRRWLQTRIATPAAAEHPHPHPSSPPLRSGAEVVAQAELQDVGVRDVRLERRVDLQAASAAKLVELDERLLQLPPAWPAELLQLLVHRVEPALHVVQRLRVLVPLLTESGQESAGSRPRSARSRSCRRPAG